MSAPVVRQQPLRRPEKGANNGKKHAKFEMNAPLISSHEPVRFNHCQSRGCADLP